MMIDGFILNYFWRERFSEILLLHQKIKYFHDKLFDTLTIFTSPYFVTPKPHFLGKLIFAIFCFSSAEGKSDLESHHQH